VHVSPTGQLHKISFAGLSKDDGSYLIDKMEINTMASTAYYNHDATFSASENMSISLFGGINYSSDSSSSYPWQYLNGTKSETDALARSYKNYTGNVNYLTGDKATKSNFLSVASNSNILHIATHGFFFPDPKEFYESLIDSAESGDIKFRGGPATRATDLYVNSENPLMRSGLIFAGANDYWNGTQTNAEDNGIITALDVVNLNLSKTKLVVMSACESGLGDIVGGEGVYGLQRAFKMAGADFIIMSLWQVPDKETAEFMQVFYSLLYKEKDIRASFLQTQSIMRKKYDPYYWAAFVLIE
jgi:CHAT domain-containing protein